jgi:hypothetical protein
LLTFTGHPAGALGVVGQGPGETPETLTALEPSEALYVKLPTF